MMKTWLAMLVGLVAAASGVLLLGWLLWRLWSEGEEVAPEAIELEVPEIPPVAESRGRAVTTAAEFESQVEEEAAEPAADDLKVIEGIGPKISQVLREAGILTFVQLAETDAESIQAMLEAADPRLGRLANPATWPDQAALAAEGRWEALEDLQGKLKGGRRA